MTLLETRVVTRSLPRPRIWRWETNLSDRDDGGAERLEQARAGGLRIESDWKNKTKVSRTLACTAVVQLKTLLLRRKRVELR